MTVADLWVDPCRQWGQVCVTGTDIPTSAVAAWVWVGEDPRGDAGYNITLRQAVVACWWEATHGEERYRKAWVDWADEVFDDLWHSRDGWLPPAMELR